MGWTRKGSTEKEDIETLKKKLPITSKKQVEEEKEEVKEINKVVAELPQYPSRSIRGEDGNIYNLKTIPEAIEELLEKVDELLRRTEED